MAAKVHSVIIIGTGPAGLTAAIYAARAGNSPLLFAGLLHGGQLTTTTEVENFPGFEHGIMGPKLMADMTKQAERVGAQLISEEVTRVDFSQPVKRLWTDDKEYQAHTVIIATGATALTLGLKGEAELMGRGLSTCATCDGFFYKGKNVVVVGGGDSAMEESNYLAKLCKEVILIHRRPEFRASKIMQDRTRNNPVIKMRTPFTISETQSGPQGLTGVVLKNIATGKTETIEIDGLFYAIGHRPNSKVFAEYVDLDSNGYIKVKNFTETKTPGIFAAGDIADPLFRQAVTAAGMGCQAAIQAQHYMQSHL